jgi:hypothetical protein
MNTIKSQYRNQLEILFIIILLINHHKNINIHILLEIESIFVNNLHNNYNKIPSPNSNLPKKKCPIFRSVKNKKMMSLSSIAKKLKL